MLWGNELTRQLAKEAGDDLAMGRNLDKPPPPTVIKTCVTGVLTTLVSQIEQATPDLLVGLYKNELRESNNCYFFLKNERIYVSACFCIFYKYWESEKILKKNMSKLSSFRKFLRKLAG